MEILLKNSIHTVKIDGYSAEGSGIARINGQVIFVKGALMGELCEIKILKALKNLAYARIERIIEPSEHRIKPGCGNFGKCGGCSFLHMDYGEELFFKKQRVEDALTRIGGLSLPVSEIYGSERTDAYRNKVIYAVCKQDGKAVAGFFRERSHDIIPVSRCLIQTPESDAAAAAVCRWIDEFGISVYDESTGKGLIRHIFVRTAFGTGQMAVCVVASSKKLPHVDALVAEITISCPKTASIVLCVNKKAGNTVLSDTFITLWGADHIEDKLCSLRFKLSPRSFFQINPPQAEKLYMKALEFAAPGPDCTAIDLYCGTGTISLVLAQKCGHVIGVETVPEAVADAGENAEKNGVVNAEFICADAAAAALELNARGITPDVVVVDPPRKGLEPDLIETISEMSPKRVVYVSCDPATLARDLKLFSSSGYTPLRLEAFDMFPRTAHVETVVLMSRAENQP